MKSSDGRPSLAERIGNVVQWSTADKVVLTASVCLTFHVIYAVAASFLLAHPELTPYMDRDFVQRVPFWITTRIVIPAWCMVSLRR